MEFLFIGALFTLLLSTRGQPTGVVDEPCTVHPDILAQNVDLLTPEPRKVFPQSPDGILEDSSHEITEEVGGYVLTNSSQSELLNKLSCSTKEMAFRISIALLVGGVHPILQIADTKQGILGEGLTIVIDTVAGVTRVTYQHKGAPHIEVLPLKLPTEKWRELMFVFSGNQLQFMVDCVVELARTIPSPDLCFSRSSTISIGQVMTTEELLTFRGAVQNASVVFGNRGYMTICPSLSSDCHTCAESFSLQSKIRELEREIEKKEQEIIMMTERFTDLTGAAESTRYRRLEFFEDFRSSDFVTELTQSPMLSPGGIGNEDFCLLNDKMYENGEFFKFSFAENAIDVPCLCFFGTMFCEKGHQKFRTPNPNFKCNVDGDQIPLDTYKVVKSTGGPSHCILKACLGILGPPINELRRCGNLGGRSCRDLRFSTEEKDQRLYRISVCCGDCDPCEGNPCPGGARCEMDKDQGNHTCICPEGLRYKDGFCEIVNECLNRSTCPENSVCVDEDQQIGHFCDCTNKNTTPGFRWNETANTCEDVDECSEGSAKCPLLSKCVNQQGSYRCVCQDGYKKNELTGKCEVHCDPECKNGGVCLPGNVCVCPSGFTGLQCERDIDECSISRPCGPNQNCINTVGSYYCTCRHGYVKNGSGCENVNECDQGLDTCPKGSSCVDTDGSYRCLCSYRNRMFNCTGYCKFDKMFLREGTVFVNKKCKECLCKNGVTVCSQLICNCSNLNSPYADKCCRDECWKERSCDLPDGGKLGRGESTATKDGCQQCSCNRTGGLSCIKRPCPDISYCPENLVLQPKGACCPVCKVPKCIIDNTVEHIDNGCTECLCKDSQWTCEPPVKCLELKCAEEDMVYQPGQCCPSCRKLPPAEVHIAEQPCLEV